MRKKAKAQAKKAARESDPAQVADGREPSPPAPVTTSMPVTPIPGAELVAAAPSPGSPGSAEGAGGAADDADSGAPTPVDTPDARDDAAQREREEIAEAMYRAAVARAEIAEAMYKAAVARAEIADVRGKAAAAMGQAVEAREKAAAERDATANARDRAALERDATANARDKAAAERDAAAAERDALLTRRLVAAPRGVSTAIEEADAELEKARLEAELQRAHLDALTGAFRREMGRLALRNEIDRARRGDGSFVVAFVDVDGLKGVNDRQGHAAGDRILRTLVATMRANLRSYDPIVRFGGDEFIFGVASIDATEVQHRIGVIDQSLRSATGVGITAGLATLNSGESLDELTARADAALIEAKRNRDPQEPTF
jgi:diguanylate cyclase (GGDEF)-like protein